MTRLSVIASVMIAPISFVLWTNALLKHHDVMSFKVESNLTYDPLMELRNALAFSALHLFPGIRHYDRKTGLHVAKRGRDDMTSSFFRI